MARSKAARARRRAGGGGAMVVPYARMRPNIGNWRIGSSAVSNAGVLTGGNYTTGPGTWANGAGRVVLTTLVPLTYQATVIAPVPDSGTPTIGRMKIDEIKGAITLSAFSAAGRYTAAVCIYVSELTSAAANTYDVRDPLNNADAARDDYFYLEAQEADMPATLTATSPAAFKFDLKLANPLIIGGGQALHVTVSMVSAVAAATCMLSSMFRTRSAGIA